MNYLTKISTGLLSILFIGILTPLASGAVYSATPANYNSLLLSLRPGDTLSLASGNYPFLSINGLNGSPNLWITITGPASGPPATIYATSGCCNTVQILNSSYVALKNLTIDSRGLAVDGINSHAGLANLTHDILIEGNTLIGQNANQQIVGISTKTPTWGWIIRKNIIDGAGTGLYLGNSDGSCPFIGGIIEDNLVRNTIGYNMEIKHQSPRPTITGMPTGQSVTIIRHNVFIKDNQASPYGDRPNLLVGGFPDSGAGSTDMYQIYGNFLYHNPREALFQAEGRVSIHDNVFVDGNYAAINLMAHNAPLKLAYVYNNTIYTKNYGVYFNNSPSIDDQVTGNAIFAGTPISTRALTHASDNVTDAFANAALYVKSPSFTLGSMNFYPLVGKAKGTALDLSKFTGDAEYSLDFNQTDKGASALFRGAYAGEGVNPGWQLQSAVKPITTPPPPPSVSALQCNNLTLTSGNSSLCSVVLTGAPANDIAVTVISDNAALVVPGSVNVSKGATSASFQVTAGPVMFSKGVLLTALLNGSVSQSMTINPLVNIPGVASLACTPSLISGSTGTCIVGLTMAPASDMTVALSTANAALAAPSSILVSAGTLSATFPVTAGSISANQSIDVTATLNTLSATFPLLVQVPPAFYLRGNSAEFASLVNGATVTPTTVPAGLAGNVVVRGTGAVVYAPLGNGDGVSFKGTQSTNTAFLAFSGAPISSLFNQSQSDLTFYLKSNHSLAERQTTIPSETVFQVDDGVQRLFYFSVGVSNSRLVFYFGPGSGYYSVPGGQEDVLFGKGVIAKFRLTWNGSLAVMYMNDASVASFAYTPVKSSWTSNASFTIGATSVNIYGGGYTPSDDSLADFRIEPAPGGFTPVPQASLSPSSLTFAAQSIGVSGAPQSVTLSNPGTAALTITSIAITGANATDFAQTNTCGSSVAAGGSCTISVTFIPSGAGSRAAAVTISDNAAGSPHTITLTGTGAGTAQASLSPSSLTFAAQSIGVSGAAQSVTLSNPGTAALTITSIAITGANATDFAQTNTCGSSVAAGGSCTISVTFIPSGAGSRAAAVTISDNAAGSPHTITLTGTGAVAPTPSISLSVSSLAFANQIIGTTSAAQSVTLSNPGTAALSLAGISITGANAAEFAQSNSCGFSLQPGGSCTILTTFTPAAAGGRSAMLAVANNTAGSPNCVTLSGAGTQPTGPAFSLKGIISEVPSLLNGATVTPANAPTGLTGKVMVRGTGSVAYAPLPNGDGLSFQGKQGSDTGFLAFSGTPVSSLFNSANGDLTFSMQSKYSLSERLTSVPSAEYVFQVDNGSQRSFYFSLGTSGSRLVFYIGISGVNNYYALPLGQEDLLFGKNVVAKVRLTWNGSRAVLYMNDTSVLSFAYTPVTSTWGANSSFTIGATSLNYYGGGYNPCAEAVADFEIK